MISVKKQFKHLKIELEAIKLATNNFADEHHIGQGGFGKVYMGKVAHSKGSSVVALKRLDRAFGQGDPQFWKEIVMLSLYKHENIVSLLGFCDDYGEKILVYEYASKRSLDLYLNKKDLTWVQRLNICIGAARGLAYLHSPGGTHQRVLHRDIKSSNILLDENWNAKIADFGLSKFGPTNSLFTFLVSNVVGTLGYVDPLYAETGLLTKESDVYSFGVVMFEVLCGRLCLYNNDKRQSLIGLIRMCHENDNIKEIIHANIKDHINPFSLEVFTTLGYQCLNRDREKRPLMTKVVKVLETALRYQDPPLLPTPPPLLRSKSGYVSLSRPQPPPLESSNVQSPPSTSHASLSASPSYRSLKTPKWMRADAMERTLWDVPNTLEKQSSVPQIDLAELETLFLAAKVSNRDSGNRKLAKVRLIHQQRACGCEAMLRKLKIPLHDITNAILTLDSHGVNIEEADKITNFYPTREEMEMLTEYTGDKEILGKCEKYFLELMKIPNIEPKLQVFAFTITFSRQVDGIREKLNTIKEATKEIKESKKLFKIMQMILKIGNKLYTSTGQGSVRELRLDGLRKLVDKRATNNKTTLLHYLCKVVSEQTPELLDFDKDLIHLQAAYQIQLLSFANETRAMIIRYEKMHQEFDALANDGDDVSARFRKAFKSFLDNADAHVPALIPLFDEIAQYADSLAAYFGEHPKHCSWEKVITSLVSFIRIFKKAHDENIKSAPKRSLRQKSWKKRHDVANTSRKKAGSLIVLVSVLAVRSKACNIQKP